MLFGFYLIFRSFKLKTKKRKPLFDKSEIYIKPKKDKKVKKD